MSFNQRVTERRRLDILLLLAESPEYETSQMMVYQALPVASSADAISADMAWLEEQGLVYRQRKGRYAVPENINLAIGRLQVARKGDSFVQLGHEIGDRGVQGRGQAHQPVEGNAVLAQLVLLELLEGDAADLRESDLGHAL